MTKKMLLNDPKKSPGTPRSFLTLLPSSLNKVMEVCTSWQIPTFHEMHWLIHRHTKNMPCKFLVLPYEMKNHRRSAAYPNNLCSCFLELLI
jgi:hypothetical protein